MPVPMTAIPPTRVRLENAHGINPHAAFVLYWMIAARRPTSNFALDRAVEWALELRKPVVVLEALRVGYSWASDRLHAFILQGMAVNASSFAKTPVTYYPYVEQEADEGKGLLEELASR